MTAKRSLRIGDRVETSKQHRWAPGRKGTVVEVDSRTGNRYVVKFDEPEIGFYRETVKVMTTHGEEEHLGEPRLLRLGEIDLELLTDEPKK